MFKHRKQPKMENQGIDNGQTDIRIHRPIKFIHFSDGVEEVFEEDNVNEVSSFPNVEEQIDPKTLSWAPWFSYYAWKSGTKMLNAVDYAGESLATFFGIITPKYQIEIDEYERLQEEKRKLEEESVGWVPKHVGGDIPLVLNEPARDKSDQPNV